MALSVLDLFSVGIGPSSSHTVGPMRAAKQFADGLKGGGLLSSTTRVQAELFGSLGATGRGHGSDKAVVLGLQGLDPETVDTFTADDVDAGTGVFTGKGVMDLLAQSVRLGWTPSYPTFNRSSLALADEADAAGQEPAAYVVDQLKSGALRFAVEDPEAEENHPRILSLWRPTCSGRAPRATSTSSSTCSAPTTPSPPSRPHPTSAPRASNGPTRCPRASSTCS